MQPSTVIPHTAEMVLKPSQLAFKIVQAVAMGKQELLREDLCKAITEQMKASSGRWNPARLCSVLFRVSQVAPGTTLLRDMVLSAHEDLEKALSTSLSRVSRGSTRELSELAMVLRRVPTTCDKGERDDRRLWSLLGKQIPSIGPHMELLDLAFVGVALQDCPNTLKNVDADDVDAALKWLAIELCERLLAMSSQGEEQQSILNIKAVILSLGVIGKALHHVELEQGRFLQALPSLVEDISSRISTVQSLVALGRSVADFPKTTTPYTVRAMGTIVGTLHGMAIPQVMSSPETVAEAVSVVTQLVRQNKGTMQVEDYDGARSFLERIAREVLIPVHLDHPFNLHQVLLVCRGYRALNVRLPAVFKFIKLAVKVDNSSCNKLALAEVMEHCIALGFQQPTSFFVPIVEALSKEPKYSRTSKKLREMLRKIQKESQRDRSTYQELA